jgi:hypothetical protein
MILPEPTGSDAEEEDEEEKDAFDPNFVPEPRPAVVPVSPTPMGETAGRWTPGAVPDGSLMVCM